MGKPPKRPQGGMGRATVKGKSPPKPKGGSAGYHPVKASIIPKEPIDLDSLGAYEPPTSIADWDVVKISAPNSRGKTHFASTYPAEKVVVMDCDLNGRNVFPQFQDVEEFPDRAFYKVIPYRFPDMPGSTWKDFDKLFDKFQHDFYKMLSHENICIIIDSATIIYGVAKEVLMNRKAQTYKSGEVVGWDAKYAKKWLVDFCQTVKRLNEEREAWNRDHPDDPPKGFVTLIFTVQEKKLLESTGAGKDAWKVWKGKWEEIELPIEVNFKLHTSLRITELKGEPRLVIQQDKGHGNIEGVSVPYYRGATWLDTISRLREMGEDWEEYPNAKMLNKEVVWQLPAQDDDQEVEIIEVESGGLEAI